MAPTKRKRKRAQDPYRRIRKPVPPPTRIAKDRRRKMEERDSEREVDESIEERRR